MGEFSAGDILFIALIFGVIHGIMWIVGLVRQRKSRAKDNSGPASG